MTYLIVFKREALKDLKSIPAKSVQKIKIVIDKLAEDPSPAGCKKLAGKKEDIWRVRVGDYRILYLIDDSIKIIDIHKVGHRKDIYE